MRVSRFLFAIGLLVPLHAYAQSSPGGSAASGTTGVGSGATARPNPGVLSDSLNSPAAQSTAPTSGRRQQPLNAKRARHQQRRHRSGVGIHDDRVRSGKHKGRRQDPGRGPQDRQEDQKHLQGMLTSMDAAGTIIPLPARPLIPGGHPDRG